MLGTAGACAKISGMNWSPRVTVAAVIKQGEQYLMVEEKESAGKIVFNQPAGHLEPNESLLEAACREVLEETGRAFQPTGLVGIYRWPRGESGRTYLRFCFTGEVGDRQPDRQLDPDIVATHWLTYGELIDAAGRLRSPLVLRCIKDANHTTAASLELLHDLA